VGLYGLLEIASPYLLFKFYSLFEVSATVKCNIDKKGKHVFYPRKAPQLVQYDEWLFSKSKVKLSL
jgi:hypothetical protein